MWTLLDECPWWTFVSFCVVYLCCAQALHASPNCGLSTRYMIQIATSLTQELHDMMHAVYSMFLNDDEDGGKQVTDLVLVFAKLLHIGGSSNDIEGKKEADAGLSFAQPRRFP